MDFREAVLAMAEARPNSRVSTIVALALALEKPNVDNAQQFGQWATRQAAVANEVKAGRKISAIKELRQLTGCGLAQAKYALDTVAV